MSEDAEGGSGRRPELGVGDALRSAVERTLAATAGQAASTRERALGLLDDVARRGRGARDELARRGHRAGAGVAGRRPDAGGDLAERLRRIEARLAAIEGMLRREGDPGTSGSSETNPKAEG